MSNTYKVAVMLATYNGADWIEAQISSINAQLGCEIHIYIRDDGSTDRTLDIIKKLALHFPLSVIDSEGVFTGSAAGNFFKILGIVDFQGYDYVALADQDDVWFPEKISEAVQLIRKSCSAGYSSNLIAFDNNFYKSWMLNKKTNQRGCDYLFQGASAGCTYLLSAVAVKLIKNVMGVKLINFPKIYSHDWIIYAICRSHGLRWIHDDRSFIGYRQHGRNVFGAKPGLKGLVSKFKLVRAGWYRNHILYLKSFIAGDALETRLLLAIERMSFLDRLFLLSRVGSLRREFSGRLYLTLLILFNLL